jgi:hypothetical protein
MRAALAKALAACVVLAAPAAGAQPAEPFHIRNLNPLVAIFGLPAWDTVVPGTRFRLTTELANHYRFSSRGGERLTWDGETSRTTFALTHGFKGRWAIGVELPYIRQSGGQLDDLVDGWHSAFNLPDGARNLRPESALEFRMAMGGHEFFGLRDSASGFGDTQLKLATGLGAQRRFTLQGTLKLPTGDETLLAGSGSADFALTLMRAQGTALGSRPAGYFWGVGGLYLGEPDNIDFASRSVAYTGIVGGALRLWPRTGLKAQVDYHSAFYRSALEEIGEHAIEITFGAWIEFGATRTLELAIVEDLAVSASPDVVLHAAFEWQW